MIYLFLSKIKKPYFRAMIFLRKILFPFAILYWLITFIRNWCYDVGLFKSKSYKIPIIAVGNLSVGGTGKTPHIEYLIHLLKEYKIATLSRGYKRLSSGFVLAKETTTSEEIGDEPYQFHSKFPNISVAVDADRRHGIEVLQKEINPDIILLDDAFQHRKVKAGFYILLTTYADLFADDYILPFGNLREPSSGKKRANVIIVTKCPATISELAQEKIKQKLKTNLPIYFSTILYDDFIYNENEKIAIKEITRDKLLVAGIANPNLFFEHLKKEGDSILSFPDHHNFTEADLVKIEKAANSKIIITTEKDYMRLKGKLTKVECYYLPIKSKLISTSEEFDKMIINYVEQSTRNS